MGLFNDILSQWGGTGPGMMWGYGGYGMGWFGGIMMFVFWGVLIVGLVFFIRWLAVPSHGEHRVARGAESAMEILRRRYASGEINKQEFDERRKDLQ